MDELHPNEPISFHYLPLMQMLNGIYVVIHSHGLVNDPLAKLIITKGKSNVTVEIIQLILTYFHHKCKITNENISLLNKFQKELHGLHQCQDACKF
jgi:hypothetical protein